MKTDGTLRQLPSGAWAIQVSGCEPVRILTGEVFMIEVAGRIKRTRLAQRADGKYHSTTGAELGEGMRAGFYDSRAYMRRPAPERDNSEFLAEADRLMATATAHVAEIRARIDDYKRNGLHTRVAQEIFERLVGTLEVAQRQRDIIARLVEMNRRATRYWS